MHAYEIGAKTHFLGSPIGAKPQTAEVLAKLPPEDGQPGYRVQCFGDGRVRHVQESELAPTDN